MESRQEVDTLEPARIPSMLLDFFFLIPQTKKSFYPDSNLSTLVPDKILCEVQTRTMALALGLWGYLTAGAMISWWCQQLPTYLQQPAQAQDHVGRLMM